jgi:hypothetical protein
VDLVHSSRTTGDLWSMADSTMAGEVSSPETGHAADFGAWVSPQGFQEGHGVEGNLIMCGDGWRNVGVGLAVKEKNSGGGAQWGGGQGHGGGELVMEMSYDRGGGSFCRMG